MALDKNELTLNHVLDIIIKQKKLKRFCRVLKVALNPLK